MEGLKFSFKSHDFKAGDTAVIDFQIVVSCEKNFSFTEVEYLEIEGLLYEYFASKVKLIN